MTAEPILLWPDPMLRRVCDRVPDAEIADMASLADALFAAMYAAPGRGLAAPQIGRSERIFVTDIGWKDGAPSPAVFINPEVVSLSDETVTREESCLSIPREVMQVTRPARITLRWTGLGGTASEGAFSGIEAAIVQHELDHLDGIVIYDRIARGAAAPDSRARPPRP